MRDPVLHLSVTDDAVGALVAQLERIVDDEAERGQWTLMCLEMPEEGMGGTISARHSVRVDAFGVTS